MIEPHPWAYVGLFAASLLATVLLTPIALRLARRYAVLDVPGGHKGHHSPVPYLGGVAIVVAFSAAVLVAAVLSPVGGVPTLALILGLAVGLAVLGLVDDLRGLGPAARFAAETAAAVGLWAAGSGVQILTWEPGNLVITVVWVVGITNAFNLLDNMDGLSAGVAVIASGFLLLIAGLNGQFLVASLAAALAGCALGFLKHNVHPAKIYMGDAGSLFLGFLLAVLAIRLRFDGPAEGTFLVPILVLAVAIFDTTLVVISRLAHRRSPFQGGRDHTSHRLVFVGLPVRVAVGLIYGAAVACGWIALVVSRVDAASALLLSSLVIVVGLSLGWVLGGVPVYENSKRRHLMIQEVVRHEPEAEQ